MRARTWGVFILVNIIVSATVILTVLFLWERLKLSPATPITPAPSPSLHVHTESAPFTPTPAQETTPGPVLYVVQAGDTLSGIARAYDVPIEELMAVNHLVDPNLLYVGQTLIIPPRPTPTPVASPLAAARPAGETVPITPPPTITPAGPATIQIGQVLGSGNLSTEVVVLRCQGGMVNLERWTLSGTGGNLFTFPAVTLFPEAQLRIHSAAGRSTPLDLYWGRTTPAWQGGELITLRDDEGNVVDTYIVP
ncbi:MAG: LysM peptidoglycan-binding domain-containing protein [Anaerolineae bacterium]|nr:LysM peptidoglycan-binding domain-containing protein [Anaerolineae bacterium]